MTVNILICLYVAVEENDSILQKKECYYGKNKVSIGLLSSFVSPGGPE